MSYAVVDLTTGQEVAGVERLPARVHVKGVLRADFDRVGLTALDANGEARFKLVPRIEVDRPSPYHVRSGAPSVTFDGHRVVVDPGWAVRPEDVRTAHISRIKSDAFDAIVLIAPEWKQRNLVAQATLLLRKGQQNWTGEDFAAWDSGEIIWRQIEAIRAESNAKEAAVTALGDDLAALLAWDGHGA